MHRIFSTRSGESEDTRIVQFALACRAGPLKLDWFARGERLPIWNGALRTEDRLRGRARIAGVALLGRKPRSKVP